ncbi:MAG TPA: hypothetical protein VFY87_04335 [Geminicoccaceae bacterium]|nr:hypothetical protein [Geminicoccaceae bacterium]
MRGPCFAALIGSYLLASALIIAPGTGSAAELRAAAPAPSFGRAPVGDVTLLPTVAPWQAGEPVRQIPRRHPARAVAPGAGAPLDARSLVAPGGPSLLVPLRVVAGQGFAGAVPPDAVGAVGRAYFIQAVNSFDLDSGGGGAQVAIYDKGGRRLAGPFRLSDLWPNPSDSCARGLGDGVVVYDAAADRFIISQLTEFDDFLCVYVAKTSNPLRGGFYAYQFQTLSFPDYPKIAVWRDMHVVTANEFSPTVYALERASMLQGRLARIRAFEVDFLPGFLFQALTPATLTGTTPPPATAQPIVARHRDTEIHGGSAPAGKDLIELWRVAVDFARPSVSALVPLPPVPVADFDSDLCGGGAFPCIRQKGTTNRLDAIPEVIMWPLQYRKLPSREVLVGTLTTNVSTGDRAGLYWFDLQRTTGGWSARQSAAYAPGTSLNRWMGSIGVDKQGNPALGYSGSSNTQFPSIRVTGRLAGDPLGSLRQEILQKASPAAQLDFGRWGDYAAMTVDPVNDCDFWFTTEFVGGDNLWRTQIATYRFPGCG